MQPQKIIIKGRLDFGNVKSFEKALTLFKHRLENFYKNDTLIDIETMFDEEGSAFNIPRLITSGSNKTWNNTISAFEFLAQFAVSGQINAFIAEGGKAVSQYSIEPQNEKAAVQAYLAGKATVQCKSGEHEKAMRELDQAITSYNKHAMAYEKRGYVKFMLKQYDEALIDLEKSIALDDQNPDAYLGKAIIMSLRDKRKESIELLDNALKLCFPVQSIYWKMRRIKGHMHMKENQFAEASQEFKFFLNKKFENDDPNYSWVKVVMWDYANALIAIDNYEEALKWLNLIEDTPAHGKVVPLESFYTCRAELRKKLGVKNWEEDSKKAKAIKAETKNEIEPPYVPVGGTTPVS